MKLVLSSSNRLGAHFKNVSFNLGTEQTFTLSKIILHPRFNKPLGLSNDIALLKLSRPALINTKVGPVCIPTDNSPYALKPKRKCYVTGEVIIKLILNYCS